MFAKWLLFVVMPFCFLCSTAGAEEFPSHITLPPDWPSPDDPTIEFTGDGTRGEPLEVTWQVNPTLRYVIVFQLEDESLDGFLGKEFRRLNHWIKTKYVKVGTVPEHAEEILGHHASSNEFVGASVDGTPRSDLHHTHSFKDVTYEWGYGNWITMPDNSQYRAAQRADQDKTIGSGSVTKDEVTEDLKIELKHEYHSLPTQVHPQKPTFDQTVTFVYESDYEDWSCDRTAENTNSQGQLHDLSTGTWPNSNNPQGSTTITTFPSQHIIGSAQYFNWGVFKTTDAIYHKDNYESYVLMPHQVLMTFPWTPYL